MAVISGHGVAYYPTAYKKWVAEFVKLFEDKQFTRFEGLVRVRVVFDIKKPRTSKLLTPKGDIDNYVKSVLDGLTKVGMWEDDKQVAALLAIKRFAAADGGIHLQIQPYSPEEDK